MLMPIANIARVRDSGRVRSARNAVTGPETAPRPWTTRATTSAAARLRAAPSAEPATCRRSPTTIRGLRPMRSDQTPKGICITACVEPVGAHRESGEERRSARQRARVQREDWQKQEQPQ